MHDLRAHREEAANGKQKEMRNEPIYVARNVNTYSPRAAFFAAFEASHDSLATALVAEYHWSSGLVRRAIAISSSSTGVQESAPRIYGRLEAYEDVGTSHIEGSIHSCGTRLRGPWVRRRLTSTS